MNRTFSPPIGVFDSGVGGLSVWREIVRLLPGVDTIYVADQAHIPYGPRPLAEVRRYAEGITRFLLDQGARLIVIACNTASGAALHTLRSRFPDVPFVGMEPAVKPAAERTHTGIVGVIATPATFQGELFRSLVARFASQVDVRTQICPGLVAAVEAEALDTPETVALLRRCLSPLLTAGIDQLVLGCTHYPFLAPTIQQITGPHVDLVDPAPAVARQVRRLLSRHHWLDESRREAEHRFYSTGDAAKLRRAARSLVGYEGRVNSAVWDGDLLRVA
jgi:glutamate racemase